MNGLVSALEQLTSEAYTNKSRCNVDVVLQQMSAEEAAKVADLIDRSSVPATKIAQVLQANGYRVGWESVNRHRKRVRGTGCRCPK